MPPPSHYDRSMVIVCTRNRPEDVVRALRWTQESAPGIAMLVADASDADRQTSVRCSVAEYSSGTFLACEPGLARQRNQALAWIRQERPATEIVHFIDDDTEPLPGYFEAIEKAFSAAPHLGGVGGVVMGEPLPRFRRLKRLIGISSSRPGVVLPSGYGTMGHYPDWEATDVQRLPGCAMSYRTSAISGIEFDNRLEGYSYGEDLFFSYALSETHPLATEPTARVRHHLSPTNRSARAKVARDSIPLMHRFVRENRRRGLKVPAFWGSVLGDIALRLGLGLATFDRDSLAFARGLALGAVDTIRDPLPVSRDRR